MTEIMAVILASFFLQLGSHFIPWAAIVGKRKLHPVAAYTIGTLTIGLTFTIWALLSGQTLSLVKLLTRFWLIVIAGGAGVATGYAIDWAINTRNRAHELKQENEMLMDQRDEPESRA